MLLYFRGEYAIPSVKVYSYTVTIILIRFTLDE